MRFWKIKNNRIFNYNSPWINDISKANINLNWYSSTIQKANKFNTHPFIISIFFNFASLNSCRVKFKPIMSNRNIANIFHYCFDSRHLIIEVSQEDAEQTTRALGAQEGIFAGISSGGAVSAALRLSREVENAVIAVIICDRGDRYLSTGVFPA